MMFCELFNVRIISDIDFSVVKNICTEKIF